MNFKALVQDLVKTEVEKSLASLFATKAKRKFKTVSTKKKTKKRAPYGSLTKKRAKKSNK